MRHSAQRAASKIGGIFMKRVLMVTMNAEEVLDHEGHSSGERNGARLLRFCILGVCAFGLPLRDWDFERNRNFSANQSNVSRNGGLNAIDQADER
jgi:hypothetical protein